MSNAIVRRRQGYAHDVEIREHRLTSDEPERRGGTDLGPTPTELLAASLASCTAITLEMYADRKEWDLGEVEVEVEVDFTESEQEMPAGFDVRIRIPTRISTDQHKRLLVIAGKCPVHKALAADNVQIKDHLEQVEA